MTFAEIIPLLLQGEKVSREVWRSSGYYWWINDTDERYMGLLISNSYDNPGVERKDLEATDWAVVEDNNTAVIEDDSEVTECHSPNKHQ